MVAIDVEFDGALHSVSALNAAAYRIIGTASCQIEKIGPKYVCHLTAVAAADPNSVRLHFIDLVTDECLRERLSERTEPVRNLILSLAFGALAAGTPTDH
jgi:His-Xaa-Ser system protein HxsD